MREGRVKDNSNHFQTMKGCHCEQNLAESRDSHSKEFCSGIVYKKEKENFLFR